MKIPASERISIKNGARPQLDDNGNVIVKMATCGVCGNSWNDALISGRTPVPSGRCPYEYFHEQAKPSKVTHSLHIEGRRWFQRTYGNTYHSIKIFADGECIASLPYQYGYGDGYLQTALDWLRDNRPDLLPDKGFDEKGNKQFGTRYLREECHATYSCIDVSRQKDL